LLIRVSQSMKACIRDEDVLARIGGDEFVIVLDTELDKNSTNIVVLRKIAIKHALVF
jgi:GGDEF domain-containing protein